MEDQKTWSVVRFVNENSVEAIPTSWIIGNKCYWPPFTSEKLFAAIRKHITPNTCWPLYEIQIFRNSAYDDYGLARKKARKAEETSDLNSDTEQKRQRKRKVLSSSSEFSEDDDSYIKPVPKLTTMNRRSIIRQETDSQSIIPGMENTAWQEKSSSSQSSPQIESEFQGSSCICCPLHKDGTYIKELLKQQHFIKHIVLDLLEEMKTIKKIDYNKQIQSSEESIIVKFKLPLTTIEELNNFENYLKNEKENFMKATLEVCKIGGKTVYDFIRRALSTLITNDLANMFSYYGRKQKKCFYKTSTAKLVIAAAEMAVNADLKSTETSIQTWLRRANERRMADQKREINFQHRENIINDLQP